MGVLAPTLVTVQPRYKSVFLSPADPTYSGASDVIDDGGAAIVAGDLQIRDTTQRWFYFPMAFRGYRTALIYLENQSTAWDQTPTIQLWGAVGGGGGLRGALLLSITGVVTASVRMSIGASEVGLGGRTGVSPLPTAGYYHYAVPAIVDGWMYLALALQFSTAPTQGQFDDIVIVRQG